MAGTINNTLVVRSVLGTAAGVLTDTFTLARAASLYDAVGIATNGGAGTMTIRNNLTAITGALDFNATDTAVVRPSLVVTQGGSGTFVSAQKNLAVGAILTFARSADTVNCETYVYLYPTPAVTA